MSANVAIRERPILFSGPMVRAILDGRKTQTRRVIVPQPVDDGRDVVIWWRGGKAWDGRLFQNVTPPYARVRNHLVELERAWVRENWLPDPPLNGWPGDLEWDGSGRPIRGVPQQYRSPKHCIYAATWNGPDLRWRPSIHMPRWASRLTLEITDVRVERVQSITDDDAWDEGCADFVGEPIDAGERWILPREAPRDEYRRLWDKLNAKRGYGWDANPWVWALTFMVVPQ